MSAASASPTYADMYDEIDGSRTLKLATIGDRALRDHTPSGITRARMQKTIMGIGSAIIGAFLIIVVLSQVYNLDIIQATMNPDDPNKTAGPFGNLTQDFVQYGTAGLTLVGIGLIIYGASYAMSMFSGWGGGGR
jgi:hypothetical protein